MKGTRHSEEQIIAILKQGEAGVTTAKSVFYALLAKGEASVTSRGIHFRKEYFVSPRLLELNYTARAANSGTFGIEIRYDDHFADQVWFCDPVSSEWMPAMNVNEETYRLKASFFELEEFRREHERYALQAKAENVHRKDEKAVRINKMTRQAAQQAKEQREGLSRSSDGGIRENKRIDQAAEDAIHGQGTLNDFGPQTRSMVPEKEDRKEGGCSPPERNGSARKAAIVRELWRQERARLGQ